MMGAFSDASFSKAAFSPAAFDFGVESVGPPPYRPSPGGYVRPIPLEVVDFDTRARIQDDHELVEIVQILVATGVFYGKV